MVDFILFVFICLVFFVGLWFGIYLGRTYQTFAMAWAAGKAWVKDRM